MNRIRKKRYGRCPGGTAANKRKDVQKDIYEREGKMREKNRDACKFGGGGNQNIASLCFMLASADFYIYRICGLIFPEIFLYRY